MSQALQRMDPDTGEILAAGHGYSSQEIDVIKEMYCRDSTDEEFSLFMAVCKRTDLDPFRKEIYAIKRYNTKSRKEEMAIQVSVDGLRSLAERSGKYQGQMGPWWTEDGVTWLDVWLKKTPPAAAKIGVRRAGWREPLFAVARYDAYIQTFQRDGSTQLAPLWRTMPDVMLAKCAEALALRRAFPRETAGFVVGRVEDEPSEVEEALEGETHELCDPEPYRIAWFATVKGTSYEDAPNTNTNRARWLHAYTGGGFSSLKDFLEHANEQTASAMIVAINRDVIQETHAAKTTTTAPVQDASMEQRAGEVAAGEHRPAEVLGGDVAAVPASPPPPLTGMRARTEPNEQKVTHAEFADRTDEMRDDPAVLQSELAKPDFGVCEVLGCEAPAVKQLYDTDRRLVGLCETHDRECFELGLLSDLKEPADPSESHGEAPSGPEATTGPHKAPSAAQLRSLIALANYLGEKVPEPKTFEEAAATVQALNERKTAKLKASAGGGAYTQD